MVLVEQNVFIIFFTCGKLVKKKIKSEMDSFKISKLLLYICTNLFQLRNGKGK